MCLIIDTNVLGAVFNQNNAKHNDFKPVLEWIVNGAGKIVYGGSKYMEEITKYARIFILLSKQNKAVNIDTERVDQQTLFATQSIVHPDFDDQHLVGLLLASGCKIICTADERTMPYLQHRTFFTAADEPKIYQRRSNRNLLTRRYYSPCCGNCIGSTVSQANSVLAILSAIK